MKIFEYRFEEFKQIIAKFNKKAVKWNLPEISYSNVQHRIQHFKRYLGQDIYDNPEYQEFDIPVVHFDIVGEIPRIDGWSIHSKIEPSKENPGSNFVFTTQGHDFDQSLHTKAMFCDHCQTRRLKSKAYYIEHTDGRHMLVGSTCLKDFLPNINIESLLSYMDQLPDVSSFEDEDGGGIPREAYVIPTSLIMRESYLSIKLYGYVSKTKAADGEFKATVNDIDNLEAAKYLYADMSIDDINALDLELEDCVEDLLAKPADNDFMMNLQLALKCAYNKPKMFSYLAAGVNIWLRDKQANKVNEALPSNWVGTVGQRIVVNNMKIVGLFVTQGNYGTTLIYRFQDESGNQYTWFSSKDVGEVDDIVDLKFTIREHGEYKGQKQTIITRGTLV